MVLQRNGKMGCQSGKKIHMIICATLLMFLFRNSSALPSMGELNTTKTEKDRKNSMLLPNGGGHMIETNKIGGGSLAAAGSSVIGGD